VLQIGKAKDLSAPLRTYTVKWEDSWVVNSKDVLVIVALSGALSWYLNGEISENHEEPRPG
jgi:hypothetical protein